MFAAGLGGAAKPERTYSRARALRRSARDWFATSGKGRPPGVTPKGAEGRGGEAGGTGSPLPWSGKTARVASIPADLTAQFPLPTVDAVEALPHGRKDVLTGPNGRLKNFDHLA